MRQSCPASPRLAEKHKFYPVYITVTSSLLGLLERYIKPCVKFKREFQIRSLLSLSTWDPMLQFSSGPCISQRGRQVGNGLLMF